MYIQIITALNLFRLKLKKIHTKHFNLDWIIKLMSQTDEDS